MLTLLLAFALGALLGAALTARSHRRQLHTLLEDTRRMAAAIRGGDR
jgi:hypothetical protein